MPTIFLHVFVYEELNIWMKYKGYKNLEEWRTSKNLQGTRNSLSNGKFITSARIRFHLLNSFEISSHSKVLNSFCLILRQACSFNSIQASFYRMRMLGKTIMSLLRFLNWRIPKLRKVSIFTLDFVFLAYVDLSILKES